MPIIPPDSPPFTEVPDVFYAPALAPYLKEGFPKKTNGRGTDSSIWSYRVPTPLAITVVIPINSAWADGLAVSSFKIEPVAETNDWYDIDVDTANTASSEVIATQLEKYNYALSWIEVDQQLELHKEFNTGGAYPLASAEFAQIYGWKDETDHTLKQFYKYVKRDINGDPSSAPITVTGNALIFIKLLQRGFDSFPMHLPVWSKESVYRGYAAPAQGNLGLLGAPPGSGFPSGYEWRKSDDSSNQIGHTYRWNRSEKWVGAIKIWIDRDHIYL